MSAKSGKFHFFAPLSTQLKSKLKLNLELKLELSLAILKTTFCGRCPSVEDNLWWKTSFSGRWPSVEPFGGRGPLVNDDLWWKTTFAGKQPAVEDLQWKMNFGGRLPYAQDALWWKKTFVKPNLCWKTIFNASTKYAAIFDKVIVETFYQRLFESNSQKKLEKSISGLMETITWK